MTTMLRGLLLCLSLQLAACAHLSPEQKRLASDYAEQARSDKIDCPDIHCDIVSPLRDLGDAAYAASTAEQPRHTVILLDRGQDSLLARVHLIRSARQSIDLQTFHFERDDAGRVVLDALMDAARRGVKVRLLMDQLSGLADPALQARLAGFHRNFELRLYNPTFGQARTKPMQWLGGIVFEFRDFNKRMHNKLMLVDGRVAIIGGRNIQNEYFDWNDKYDYRDRDLLVAGPATVQMAENFAAFWNDHRAFPAAELRDVAGVLIDNHGPPALMQPPASPRVLKMAAAAENGAEVFAHLSPYLFQVGQVDFFADLPAKHDDAAQQRSEASQALLTVLADSKQELLLETPYLVMSRQARQLFRALHERTAPPQVLVSTNSLAATDAFPVYAMSHKYKRLYLRELGFEIHEFKPFPVSAPIDLAATGAADPGDVDQLGFSKPFGSGRGPAPLKRAGVRIGLHAKSLVIDEQVGIVGSHNFDPRSTAYNTESLVVVHDAAFAQALAASIRLDMQPENAWTIAPRTRLPILWGLNYNLGKLSEKLPIFDLWPLPYATSYEIKPGCAPLSPNDPKFHQCYQWVGDFPEVNLSLKSIYTRIITVFGAGLIPIL